METLSHARRLPRPWETFTEEIREGGRRQGFRVSTFSGRTGVLADVRLKSRQRVGRYGGVGRDPWSALVQRAVRILLQVLDSFPDIF